VFYSESNMVFGLTTLYAIFQAVSADGLEKDEEGSGNGPVEVLSQHVPRGT
jgi:hypothetical protein